MRVILSGAKNPSPSGVVGCGVGDAPRKRNDPFHRAVEDAGPYGVGADRRTTMLVPAFGFVDGGREAAVVSGHYGAAASTGWVRIGGRAMLVPTPAA